MTAWRPVQLGIGLWACWFVLVMGQVGAGGELKAGAATADITPPLGELIVGGWTPIPATHIHDPLAVRCLMLSDGATTIGFVLCDNVGIPTEVYDAARAFIDQETDVPSRNIVMAATHTHSATTARSDSKVARAETLSPYQEFVARRIADCVRCALNNLTDAEVGWGSVDEPSQVFNRRWFVTDPELCRNPFGGVDQVRMNPPRGSTVLVRPAGPIDPEVSFLVVRDLEGRHLAVLANYSLHYVGGVPRGHVSADYFGIFANELAEQLGAEDQNPPFVGMMSNGTSGDVNNIHFTQKGERRQPYAKMTEVGELIARRVAEAMPEVAYQRSLPLGAQWKEITLRVRKPSPEILDYFETVLANDGGETAHRRERIYAERMQYLVEGPAEISIPLQALRIGDLAVTAIPFEVFAEIGLGLKSQCPLGTNFTIELANGSFGYLPTPEQHSLGGYETWLGTNYVELGASEKIRDTLLEMLAAWSSSSAR